MKFSLLFVVGFVGFIGAPVHSLKLNGLLQPRDEEWTPTLSNTYLLLAGYLDAKL